MLLLRKNGLVYGDGHTGRIDNIRQTFNLENTDFESKKKMGYWVKKYHKYYMIDKKTGTLYFPKGAFRLSAPLYRIYTPMKQHNIGAKFTGELYGRQKDIVDDAIKEHTALIKAPTGKGKSYIIMGLINHYKVKTLIVVPGIEIMKGLYNKFNEFLTGVEIGRIGGGYNEEGDVTIIIDKSMNNKRQELSSKYNMLILDEAHEGVTSKNRIKWMCMFQCDYIYGTTATPERDDISEESFKILYGRLLVADIEVKKPMIAYEEYKNPKYAYIDWHEKLECLIADEERTKQQAHLIAVTMRLSTRNMGLVLVSHKEAAKNLVKAVDEEGCYAQEYTGDTKMELRDDILKDVQANRGVMIATYQTVGTGFDYPPLDTCFYFCPVKFKGRVKQCVGRILRDCEAKSYPLLIDWKDSILGHQAFARHNTYKSFFGREPIKYDDFLQLNFLI